MHGRIIVWAGATLLFAAGVLAQGPPAEQAALGAAFKLVQDAVAKGEVPGAAALVARDGRIVREEAYGLGDVENKTPFTPTTLCWIASITKPVTVAAAMKLVEAGQLGLDDPVEMHLPEFKEMQDKDGRHHAVTIRQLMSHTSGIQPNPPTRPDFFFEANWLARKIGDIAPAIAKTPLQFEPGSRVQYSNAAPYVLARVIEVRSGQRFHEYVQQVILEPAGMRDTYFILPPAAAPRAAVVYRDTRGQRVTVFRFDPAWRVTMTLPDGGLFSSPREIAKFVQLFLAKDQRVLAPDSVQAMCTRQAAGWGLGWALEEDGLISHSGSSGTAAWADPKTGVVGVLFFQLQNNEKISPLQAAFRKAVRAAFEQPPKSE